MYLVAIAWIYVVLMMAVAEAISPQGTVMGAVFTLLLYGALPLSVVMYLLGTPSRRRARRAAEATEAVDASTAAPPLSESSALDPDRRGEPTGDAVAAKRKEA